MKHRPTYLGKTVQKDYYIYILANEDNTILYTGVTSNLAQRIYQHKSKTGSAFTKRFNVTKLVYFEVIADAAIAIAREKQLKTVSRSKRMDLINSMNADWRELYQGLDERESPKMNPTKTKLPKPQKSDLPPGLANPAQRALAGAGITSLAKLAKLSEAEVKQLHGIGPNALRQLRSALGAKGLSFAEDKTKNA